MHKILLLISRSLGWKHIGDIPDDIKKCVLVAGQHTSNWDFIHGIASLRGMKRKAHFLIKSELFFFPLGWILKSLGGIPVDRSKNNNMVDAMVDLINDHEDLIVLMTPEGTRSYVEKWKSGFYHVANKAKIPIVLGYIDYKNKNTGIGETFETTGNKEADIKEIKKYYIQFAPKHPEKGIQTKDME